MRELIHRYQERGLSRRGFLKGMAALGFSSSVAQAISDSVEASELDYREVYGKGIPADAYDLYLNRSREKVDVFDAAFSWSAQVVDEVIEPKDTRKKIIEGLNCARNRVEKRPARAKNHGASPT